ncbi:MAG: FAD-dependent oxidoreductase, partial [Myxococcales bacterium]|nr:FAD-dependent oxidoreductase [Myxococcales bacterium]
MRGRLPDPPRPVDVASRVDRRPAAADDGPVADVDVAIIGAGLSGLAAARALEGRGLDVAVFEARDRVGGRTLSDAVGRATLDLGGQWIGPKQRRLHALARELGLTLFPTFHEGTKLLELDRRRRSYRGSIPALSLLKLLELQRTIWRIDRMTRSINPAAPWASARAEALDGISLEAWKRRHVRSRDVADLIDIAVRSFLSVEPSEVSLLHLLAYAGSAGALLDLVEIEGGAQEARFAEGAQTLSLRLRERLRGDVRLSSPVRKIEATAGGATVAGDWGELRCDRVILALPPHLCDRIAFAPGLPVTREQLHLHAPIGA